MSFLEVYRRRGPVEKAKLILTWSGIFE